MGSCDVLISVPDCPLIAFLMILRTCGTLYPGLDLYGAVPSIAHVVGGSGISQEEANHIPWTLTLTLVLLGYTEY